MAWTLKTTGIAANCTCCLVVDTSGTPTLVDLGSHAFSTDASLTLQDASDWKSITGVDSFYLPGSSPGVTFTGAVAARPDVDINTGNVCTVFMAFDSYVGSTGGDKLFEADTGGSTRTWAYLNSGALATHIEGQNRGTASTAWPTSTQFSIGVAWGEDFTSKFYYGLESGSLAADGTSGVDHDRGRDGFGLHYVGCDAGGDGIEAYPVIFALFDRELTLSELQDLHDDWKAELIDTGAGTTFSGSGTVSAGAATTTGVGDSWTEFAGSGTVAAGTASTVGTGTKTRKGSGTVAAGVASAAGTGTKARKGTGAVAAAAASAAGVGTVSGIFAGTGTVAAGAAATAGVGTKTRKGSGTVAAAAATAAGVGALPGVLAGTGTVAAGAASTVGVGARALKSAAAVAAGAAAAAGVGSAMTTRAGSGAVAAATATASGVGTGSFAVVAGTGTVSASAATLAASAAVTVRVSPVTADSLLPNLLNYAYLDHPTLRQMPRNDAEWADYNRVIIETAGNVAQGLLDNGQVSDSGYLPQSIAGNKGSVTVGGNSALTATDAGSSVTINVAAHTQQYDFGPVVFNAGSIVGLMYSATYYVYADDGDFEGGSVTYLAATVPDVLTADRARYFVGAITTPDVAAAPTTGSGGGGAGVGGGEGDEGKIWP